MMNFRLFKIVLILSTASIILSCQNQFGVENLNNGLSDYRHIRNINQSFVNNFELSKTAFFQTHEDSLGIVLKLNDQIDSSLVENYSLGMYLYQDEQHLFNEEVAWNPHPKIQTFNNHKYFIETIAIPHTQIDTLVFYLYDRDKYRTIIGNRVVLKNIAF